MKNYTWITMANIAACLGVVILHANGVFWTYPKGHLWYTANFLETFFYWPVPVFFMLSGATLIDYRERYSTKKYFRKRCQRTLIPFLIWSIFSVAYRYTICGWETEGLKDIIIGIFNTKYNSIYWFFLPLFGVYMSIPLLAAVDSNHKISIFIFLVLVTFILSSLLPTVFALLKWQYNAAIQIPITAGYVLYVLLGYIIKNCDFNRTIRFIAYGFALVGWYIHYEGTNRLSLPAGEIVGTFKGYLNFPAVMQAVGVMIFFKYCPWKKILNKDSQSALKSVAKYTFGVYLVHEYLVEQLPRLIGINSSSFWWRTGGAVLMFGISTSICWVISKIPILKRCIGL